jgi:hypothetical protein
LNLSALIAVAVFAGVLLVIFGALYLGASRSQARGGIGPEGTRVLRWALLGQITLYLLLGITAFLT